MSNDGHTLCDTKLGTSSHVDSRGLTMQNATLGTSSNLTPNPSLWAPPSWPPNSPMQDAPEQQLRSCTSQSARTHIKQMH
eukprot:4363123-Amphidinium_carterae.1